MHAALNVRYSTYIYICTSMYGIVCMHSCMQVLRYVCTNLWYVCMYVCMYNCIYVCCGAWWGFVRVDAFRPEGRGFESRSNRHVETLGKSFNRSSLWRFGVKLRHIIRAVSGALLSS